MCGGGLFASLQDVYMELFQVPVGNVDVLEISQLVITSGVSALTPASLNELRGVGPTIAADDSTVTLTVATEALRAEIAELRTDVDSNTIELSRIDFAPYRFNLCHIACTSATNRRLAKCAPHQRPIHRGRKVGLEVGLSTGPSGMCLQRCQASCLTSGRESLPRTVQVRSRSARQRGAETEASSQCHPSLVPQKVSGVYSYILGFVFESGLTTSSKLT